MLSNKRKSKQVESFAYQNLSLTNIKGEKWKAVEYYEDYYMISNHGRVKALAKHIEFSIPGKHIVSYSREERILKQGIAKRWNSLSKEYIYTLTVTFCVAQRMKTFDVSRLVWQTFIEKLDYKKDNLSITQRDGDGRNNHYKNLVSGNHSQMAELAFKRGRGVKLSNYLNAGVFAKSAKSRSKTITQYNIKGYRIKTYSSINQAEEETGIRHSNISRAAKGKNKTMGGFIWRYGSGSKKIDVSFLALKISCT